MIILYCDMFWLTLIFHCNKLVCLSYRSYSNINKTLHCLRYEWITVYWHSVCKKFNFFMYVYLWYRVTFRCNPVIRVITRDFHCHVRVTRPTWWITAILLYVYLVKGQLIRYGRRATDVGQRSMIMKVRALDLLQILATIACSHISFIIKCDRTLPDYVHCTNYESFSPFPVR